MTRAPNVHALNIYLSSIFRLRLSCPEGQISRSVGQIFTALNLAELNSTVVGLLINLVNMFIIYNTTIYSNDWNISHCFITMFITMCPPAWHWHCCTLVQPLRLWLWHVDRDSSWAAPKTCLGTSEVHQGSQQKQSSRRLPEEVARMISFQIFYSNRMQSVTIL